MNVAQTAQAVGWSVLADICGHDLAILEPGGGSLRAVLTVLPPFESGLGLGSDLREVTRAEITAPLPQNVKMSTRLQDQDSGETWKVVKREDNPADFTVALWLVKITEQDQPQ